MKNNYTHVVRGQMRLWTSTGQGRELLCSTQHRAVLAEGFVAPCKTHIGKHINVCSPVVTLGTLYAYTSHVKRCN